MTKSKDKTIRISISETDFKDLVSGKVIKAGMSDYPVLIALQDIGFDQMKKIIHLAELEFRKEI